MGRLFAFDKKQFHLDSRGIDTFSEELVLQADRLGLLDRNVLQSP